jgi:CheY-like chemotaxis protein
MQFAMATPTPTAATILIATDSVTDAALVEHLLSSEFDHIFVSTDPHKAPGDFMRHRPSVLVLAFNTLDKSECYYRELNRLCDVVQQHPHRTVILCNKDEVKRAYKLCQKDSFDDYNLFWPMTHDSSRLLMSIHHALRELSTLKTDRPSAAEFADQARHLAELEKTLDQQIMQGGHHIEAASRAMEQAAQNIGAALDGFSRKLISGALPDSVEVKNADGLENEINRFKREEVQPHLSAATESTHPLKQWAQEFKQEFMPLLESASAMNAMADRIRPTVLVVDDNEVQRKMIGKLLEAQNYHLIFAANGIQALGILHRTRPDIILMDMMMPDMDGMETTRRLKAIPGVAKTPVIMITGHSEEKIVADCLKAGAIDFVVKPFVHATLIAKIVRALSAAVPS